MNQELLDRLQKADPGLWEKIAETALSEYEYHDEDFNAWIFNAITYTNLFGPAQEAWLQYCLQEAIRWRGYSHKLKYLATSQTAIADIYFENSTWSAEGTTEAEALMRAYLAAIQEAE